MFQNILLSIKRYLRWNSLWVIISGIAVSLSLLAALSIALIMNLRVNDAIDSAALANNSRITAAAADSIDKYILEVVRTSRIVTKTTETFPERTDIVDDVYFILSEDIDTIAVFSDKGDVEVKTDDRVMHPAEELIAQSWFRAVAPGSRQFVLSNPRIQRLYPGEYRWVISMSSGLTWDAGGQTRRGVMLVDLTLDSIRELCSNMTTENAYIYLISEDGQIIYHPRQQMIYAGIMQEDTRQYAGMQEDSKIVKVGNERLLVNVADLNYARWRVVGVSSLNGMLSYDMDMPAYVMIIIALILLIVIILAFLISLVVTRPLRRLMLLMKSVQSGKWDVSSETNGIYEVAALSDSFNSMVVRIKALMEQVLKEQQALRKSEMRALHAQINPHFMYNTLDSMVCLAECGDRKNVVKMIEALASFFRLTLYGGKDIIHVRDELKHVESYLAIQKMRLGDNFDFTISMDPAVGDLQSMKMILQPLAENSLVHGIGSECDGGVIKIRAYLENNDLIYEVIDNGIGMSPAMLELLSSDNMPDVLTSHSGIGIQNIRQRIHLTYGRAYGLTFASEPDEGTVVSVRIPAVPGKRAGES